MAFTAVEPALGLVRARRAVWGFWALARPGDSGPARGGRPARGL